MLSATKFVTLASGPKFSARVTLKAKYVWVLLASYDNTGNSETQSLTVRRTISTSLSRTAYDESIIRASMDVDANISLNVSVPVLSEILGIGGEVNVKWASSKWEQYTKQLTTVEKIDTEDTFEWTFKVGPDAKLDFYRLNVVGPAGLIETDTTSIVPLGTHMPPNDITIETKVWQQYSYWSTDREGGEGGGPFDDGTKHGLIEKLWFRASARIDNIKARYADGQEISHGGYGGKDWEEVPVTLADPISRISIRAGGRIDNIKIQLKSGKVYQHGGSGGHSPVEYIVPKGFYLISLFGRSGGEVDNIQFVFTNQPPEQLLPFRIAKHNLKSKSNTLTDSNFGDDVTVTNDSQGPDSNSGAYGNENKNGNRNGIQNNNVANDYESLVARINELESLLKAKANSDLGSQSSGPSEETTHNYSAGRGLLAMVDKNQILWLRLRSSPRITVPLIAVVGAQASVSWNGGNNFNVRVISEWTDGNGDYWVQVKSEANREFGVGNHQGGAISFPNPGGNPIRVSRDILDVQK